MFKKETRTLFVILNRKNLKSNFFVKEKDVFTLNKFVLNNFEREKITHFYPDPNKTSFESKFLFQKAIDAKNEFFKKITKINYFKNINYIEELLENFLESKLTIYFYLENVIPEYNEYILINNRKYYHYKSKVELIRNIENLSGNKGKIHYLHHKFSKSNNPLINIILMKIQSKIIKFLFDSKSKELYLFSDKKSHFFNYLKSKFFKKNNIIISYHPTSNYIRILQIILVQIYKFIFDKNFREFSFFLLPTTNKKFLKENYLKKDLKINSLKKDLSIKILKEIYSYVYNYNFFKIYIEDCFKNHKIKESFFHSVRYPDLFSLSNVLSDLKNDVFLISHGSHTKQKRGGIDFIVSKNIALGLAYSSNKNIKSLSQSIYCDEFLDSINRKYKRINYVISKKTIKAKNNINIIKKNNLKTKILLVGSIKALGARRYCYESSPEFIASVYTIYDKLLKFKDRFEILLTIRNIDNEINSQILNNAFISLNSLINIKKDIILKKEIDNCDCIISYSSTVLEEGLQRNKPVMCFGLPEYNHFKSYEKISSSNLSNDLKIIEKNLKRRFILNQNIKREIDFEF